MYAKRNGYVYTLILQEKTVRDFISINQPLTFIVKDKVRFLPAGLMVICSRFKKEAVSKEAAFFYFQFFWVGLCTIWLYKMGLHNRNFVINF